MYSLSGCENMYIVSNVKMEIDEYNIKGIIANKLKINVNDIISYSYYKKAIDARDKNHVFYLCHFLVEFKNNVINKVIRNKDVKNYIPYVLKTDNITTDKKVYIIGAGPSGLFASYILALNNIKSVVIERGSRVDKRIKDVDDFFNKGILNENSNLQFGEGGAGTFSDGKLTTNINDERIEFIKNTFIRFGANEDIYYLSKPHIGSDVLINVVKNMREELIKMGVEFKFDTTLIDIESINNEIKQIVLKDNDTGNVDTVSCDILILATGHSARDIYYMLNNNDVNLEKKPFSIGVRIEHKQEDINKAQYGEKYYKMLPAADYKVAIHLDNNRSLYSFCMCPGGVVVASGSEKESIVTNGMSYNARDKENSNSALLVNVNVDDLEDDLFAGIKFQEKYERLAYDIAKNYKAPCQLYGDLIDGRESSNYKSIKPSYLPGVEFTSLEKCLPEFVIDSLKKGIPLIDKKIKGFANPDALLTAPETRSSSPVRIIRDESYQTNIRGIYPCGEGSGYSSGITTSALDGIRVASKVIEGIKK